MGRVSPLPISAHDLEAEEIRASAEQLHTTQPNLSMHAKQVRECTFICLYETAEIGPIE
jgi:hypothetical protein